MNIHQAMEAHSHRVELLTLDRLLLAHQALGKQACPRTDSLGQLMWVNSSLINACMMDDGLYRLTLRTQPEDVELSRISDILYGRINAALQRTKADKKLMGAMSPPQF